MIERRPDAMSFGLPATGAQVFDRGHVRQNERNAGEQTEQTCNARFNGDLQPRSQ